MSDLFSIAAGGMDTQRAALDVAARSVAAAEAAGPKGHGAVDILKEMVSVLNASRAFEANASVFDLAKRLAERTLDMERT